MKIDDKIKNEKLQYYFKRVPAKISVAFSGKIYKYKYLKVNKYHIQVKKVRVQVKVTYSRLNKAFEKQIKTIED